MNCFCNNLFFNVFLDYISVSLELKFLNALILILIQIKTSTYKKICTSLLNFYHAVDLTAIASNPIFLYC